MSALPTNIFLVEDHTIIVEALTLLFNQMEDIHLLGTAKTAEEAIDSINEYMIQKKLDVVITDLKLSNKISETQNFGGIRCIREILRLNRTNHHKVKIIILSAHTDGMLVSLARRLGVHGYLDKNCGKGMIQQAIKSVIAGGTYFQLEVEKNEKAFLEDHPNFWQNEISITDKEKTILKLLSQGKRNDEIREEIGSIGHATIERMLRNLREKFRATTNAQLIAKAIFFGFLNLGPD